MPDDERESDDLFEDLDKFFAPIKDVEWDEPEEAAPVEPPGEEHVTVRPEPESVVTVPPAAEGSFAEEDEEDEDWYDTASLEPVEEALGGRPRPSDQQQAVGGQAGLFTPGADEEDWTTEEAEADRPSDEELEAAAAHFAGTATEGGDGSPAPRVVQIDEESAGDLLDDLGAEEPHAFEEEEEDTFAEMAEEEPSRTVVVGAEGLGGPSWQEPTSVEVGADLDRRGPNIGERDVPAAFVTGIVLAGVAVVALLIGEGVFAVVAAIVALVAQGELYGVMVKHHRQPATAIGLVSGGLMLAGAYFHAEAGLLSMLSLGLLATFLWFMTVPAPHRKDTVGNVGLTMLGMVWVPALAGSVLIILTTFDTPVVIAVIGLTFVFDTLAFLTGSVWGGSFIQRPLAAATSPKKSIEGLIVASLGTIVVSSAFVTALVDVGPGMFVDGRVNALLLGIVVSLAATFGDLAESLVKRDLGIKDMGSILPGHGGVLDRIDSLLFVAPATLLFLRVIAF